MRPNGRSARHASTGWTDIANARPIDASRVIRLRSARNRPLRSSGICGRLPASISKPDAHVCLLDGFNLQIQRPTRDASRAYSVPKTSAIRRSSGRMNRAWSSAPSAGATRRGIARFIMIATPSTSSTNPRYIGLREMRNTPVVTSAAGRASGCIGVLTARNSRSPATFSAIPAATSNPPESGHRSGKI
jgi:hypothetical protein